MSKSEALILTVEVPKNLDKSVREQLHDELWDSIVDQRPFFESELQIAIVEGDKDCQTWQDINVADEEDYFASAEGQTLVQLCEKAEEELENEGVKNRVYNALQRVIEAENKEFSAVVQEIVVEIEDTFFDHFFGKLTTEEIYSREFYNEWQALIQLNSEGAFRKAYSTLY